jgi:hypothetical protein
MLETNDLFHEKPNETDRLLGPAITFNHPDEVLHSRSLDSVEKRAVLAAWASDAHAVPNLPAMRQLESGAIVNIDTVLAALRALDESGETPQKMVRGPVGKPRSTFMPRWRRALRRLDQGGGDDDDPPPCPAAALPPGIELELRRRRDEAWQLAAA